MSKDIERPDLDHRWSHQLLCIYYLSAPPSSSHGGATKSAGHRRTIGFAVRTVDESLDTEILDKNGTGSSAVVRSVEGHFTVEETCVYIYIYILERKTEGYRNASILNIKQILAEPIIHHPDPSHRKLLIPLPPIFPAPGSLAVTPE